MSPRRAWRRRNPTVRTSRPSDDGAASEDGSATVAAALVIAGLAVLLIALLGVGSAVLARHRAQHAADLGALAAAGVHVLGADDPCARARDLTARQEGSPRVTRCVVDSQDVLVAVTVRVHLGRWGIRDAVAQARAGAAGAEPAG